MCIRDSAPTRDLVAVDDVVSAIWRLIRHPDAYGTVVNICTGIETRMQDVLDVLIAEAGVRVDVRVDPVRVKRDDVSRNCGSVSRLRGLLGEAPQDKVKPILTQMFRAMVQGA